MASPRENRAKQKAAEARAAAEAADKRRQRIINISIGAVLLIVVVAVVGGAWMTSRSKQDQAQPDANAVVPAGVLPSGDEYAYGVAFEGNAAGKPTLEIWEDFQCPACASFEQQYGATLAQLAAAGKVNVIYRATSFLDGNYPGDHSKRAVAAWGCAIDAGKGQEFHDLVYANQPPAEGDGWTDQQLLAFGEQAGIKGEAKATFDQCVTDRTYVQWALNGTQTMATENVSATPGLFLNGQELTPAQRADIVKAIEEATGAAPAPTGASPSPSK